MKAVESPTSCLYMLERVGLHWSLGQGRQGGCGHPWANTASDGQLRTPDQEPLKEKTTHPGQGSNRGPRDVCEYSDVW